MTGSTEQSDVEIAGDATLPPLVAGSQRAQATPSRFSPSFGFGNKLFRVIWSIAWFVLARYSPPPLWQWRRMLLRAFGARVGASVRVYGSTIIWNPRNLTIGDGALLGRAVNCYNQGLITIGRDVVISWGATLCSSTHDVENPTFPLVVRPISIGDDAWIAAEAFVGPGVEIGEGAVLGARGVAMRALAPWTYYNGNPAQPIKERPVLHRSK